MTFGNREKKDLIFAGFMISLAFGILFAGGGSALLSFNYVIFIGFILAFFTAGVGFLLHELMHRYVARRYGLRAEFRAFNSMLWMTLLFSFFGFIIAAPGAVFISGRMDKEKNGKVSLAGPMTNIILAMAFLIGLIAIGKSGFLGIFFSLGLSINSLLGAFNMIPAMPFDGAKVLAWNKAVYFIVLIFAIGLFFSSWFF